MDEVGEHAECWDQSDDLHESPEGEEDSEKHLGGFIVLAQRFSIVVEVLMNEAQLCDSSLSSYFPAIF